MHGIGGGLIEMVIVCGDSMYTNGGVDDRHKGLFLDYIHSGDGMDHIGSHIPWVSVQPTAYISGFSSE